MTGFSLMMPSDVNECDCCVFLCWCSRQKVEFRTLRTIPTTIVQVGLLPTYTSSSFLAVGPTAKTQNTKQPPRLCCSSLDFSFLLHWSTSETSCWHEVSFCWHEVLTRFGAAMRERASYTSGLHVLLLFGCELRTNIQNDLGEWLSHLVRSTVEYVNVYV